MKTVGFKTPWRHLSGLIMLAGTDAGDAYTLSVV